MRSLGMKMLAFAAVAMLTAPVFAQSDTRGAKADAVFELTPSKIIDSPLGKKMGFAELLATTPPGAPEFDKIKRVFAGVIAPESVEKLEVIQQGGDDNDLQFFMRIEYSTAEAATDMITQASANSSSEVERNGKTYYSPPEGEKMPKGTVMYLADDKTVAMASGGFIDKTGGAPVTDALATAWKKMPNTALKVSIDGVNARNLVKSMVKDVKEKTGDPIVGAILDLFPTMDNINLSIDFASADLLKLNATSSDEDKASDISNGFKSLVTMAKPAAKKGLAQIEDQAPNAAATFGKLVNGMDVKQSGKSVTLNIPRPEGFEDAVQEFVPVAQQMIFQMMFGGGFGGGAR